MRAFRQNRTPVRFAATLTLAVALAVTPLTTTGCTSGQADAAGTTGGPAFVEPNALQLSPFDEDAARKFENAAIDMSHAQLGYVGAYATSPAHCKLQVACGDMSYHYDLPADGTPIIAPLNMGDGAYTFRVMQNTSGSSYVEIARTGMNVQLENEFTPFLRPNVFCNYDAQSECVKRAYHLAVDAQNEGDVVRAIYDWITANIHYNNEKAAELASSSGYVPDPDETLRTGEGICFDYASLAAAMFRSLGLPCQIVTGYVSPDDIYHAWNMIYINGEWVSAHITVEANTWCRIDLTFAAAAQEDGQSMASGTVGDGMEYTDRYIY